MALAMIAAALWMAALLLLISAWLVRRRRIATDGHTTRFENRAATGSIILKLVAVGVLAYATTTKGDLRILTVLGSTTENGSALMPETAEQP